MRPELLSQPIAQKISVSLEISQPFSYKYAKETYHFSTAYSGSATLEQRAFRVQVGICQQEVYGRTRSKVIIFLNGNPGTEFVETDTRDFFAAQVKVGRRTLRPGEPLPEGFTPFVMRPMRGLINAPHVPHGQAVLVPAEDLATMVRFAFIKRLYREKAAEAAPEPGPQGSLSTGDEDQFKKKAQEAGLIQSIKGGEHKPGGDRTPIKVTGKPISQEVIEQRR